MSRPLILLFVLSVLTAFDTVIARSAWVIPVNTAVFSILNHVSLGLRWLTGPMIFLTYVGSDPVLFLFILVLAVWLARRRYRSEIIWLVSVAFFARIVGIASKLLIQMPRPGLIDPPPYVYVSLDYGYPSGHALMSSVILGSAAILALRYARKRSTKIVLTLCCLILILLIGVSRVYLGVHWPNDVLGGYLYGACILTLAYIVRKIWSRKQQEQ